MKEDTKLYRILGRIETAIQNNSKSITDLKDYVKESNLSQNAELERHRLMCSKTTNGFNSRISSLEQWKYYIMGGTAVIVFCISIFVKYVV